MLSEVQVGSAAYKYSLHSTSVMAPQSYLRRDLHQHLSFAFTRGGSLPRMRRHSDVTKRPCTCMRLKSSTQAGAHWPILRPRAGEWICTWESKWDIQWSEILGDIAVWSEACDIDVCNSNAGDLSSNTFRRIYPVAFEVHIPVYTAMPSHYYQRRIHPSGIIAA